MVSSLESVFSVYGALRPLYRLVGEFHDGAAFLADEVIVMLVFVRVLEAPRALVVAGRARQARLFEELDCAEHGRLAYAGVDLSDGFIQALRGHMPLDTQKNVENNPPGPGHPEPPAAKVFLEFIDGFARPLAGSVPLDHRYQ